MPVIGKIAQPHVCSPTHGGFDAKGLAIILQHQIGTVWQCPDCSTVWIADRHDATSGWARHVPRWRRETWREERARTRATRALLDHKETP